jgi:hypothetical protein
MSESVDLRALLEAWPYDPADDTRLSQGHDGRQILQVRTPLGIEQYELEGRPDGLRPEGFESCFEYYKAQFETAKKAGRESDFDLAPDDCEKLFSEGTIYYLRYVRLFQMRDWSRTIRDTARNLNVFDFIKAHARRPEDQLFLEKWRPYVIRVNTTAAVMLAMDKADFTDASHLVQEAIATIEQLEELDDETFVYEKKRSLSSLSELAAEVRRTRPQSELEKLQSQLRRAIERQEFERAAELRDRIRALKK